MCLAVPLQIISIEPNDTVHCKVGEGDSNFLVASTKLLPEAPEVGDYIIIHAGFAMRKLDPRDAEETLSLMRQMIELSKGCEA